MGLSNLGIFSIHGVLTLKTTTWILVLHFQSPQPIKRPLSIDSIVDFM